MDEQFIYIVLEIVSEIPRGNVATYKQIAELAGRERNARQVGKILSAASLYGKPLPPCCKQCRQNCTRLGRADRSSIE